MTKLKSRLEPAHIMLVRHGQSAGNVAAEKAEAEGLPQIELATRDVDVPLSDLGHAQAHAAGEWIANLPIKLRPTVILSSPYERAMQTALIISNGLKKTSTVSKGLNVILDERLREREFGIIDRLTKKGVVKKFPSQAALYESLGKFYYRPPGGESWCDVVLRLRSLHDTLCIQYAGKRVLIVCHSAVISCFRYFIEQMTEQEILKIDRDHLVANCSITSYQRDKQNQLLLEKFNFVTPLIEAGEIVTRRSDVPVAPK